MSHHDSPGRYSRQLPLWGIEGQERLSRATVLVAGAGGLGSASSFYLAAAGVGCLRIADSDTVEVSNLNRQILHRQVGSLKVESARDTLQALNPELRVEAFPSAIDSDSVSGLVRGADAIVDALDNFETRYLLNSASLRSGVPLMHGAISGFDGQATTLVPGRTPCLRCLFPRSPPPVRPPALGATCGVIGSIQAGEVLKYLTGKGELLEGRLLLWDGLFGRMDEVTCDRSPVCPDCATADCRKPLL
ncbi:MAG: putative adenylyltransferase [Methanosaeta sp. PtaB.Bin039]|nr:MAG: putative adenylyltransferase [Methanosaeta sp. PtaB.Bin039]